MGHRHERRALWRDQRSARGADWQIGNGRVINRAEPTAGRWGVTNGGYAQSQFASGLRPAVWDRIVPLCRALHKGTLLALTNDCSPAGRLVLLLCGKQINEVNLRSWPSPAVRYVASTGVIVRTCFYIPVAHSERLELGLGRLQCSYKGFPFLSNTVPSWLNRAAIDHEICFTNL
jgi:hypothetical protein